MNNGTKDRFMASICLDEGERDFMKKSVHSYATKVGLMASEFFLNVLITRLLGPEGRGLLALVNNAAGLVTQFGMFGLNAANVYLSAKRRVPIGVLLTNSLLLSIAVGGIFALFVVSDFQAVTQWMAVSHMLLVFLLLAVPLQLCQQLIQGLMLGRELVYATNHIEVQIKIVQFMGIGIVIYTGMVGPESVFLIGMLSTVIAIILALRALDRNVPGFRIGRPSRPVLQRSAGYGGKSYLASLLSFAVLRIDIFLIHHFLGAEGAGLYAAGLAIINAINVLPTILSQLALARLAAMSGHRDRLRFAGRLAAFVGIVMAPMLGLVWLFAPSLFELLYGESFLDAAYAFQWLLPGVFIWSVEVFLRKVYESNGYAVWVVYAWATAFIANLVLNLLLIPVHGIVGAAMASSAALLMVGAWTFVVFGRDLLRSTARSPIAKAA